MSLFKNTLIYGGWIPTLFGGGVGIWWLESDKTIGDLLRKTGKPILSTKGEFQKIFYELEDNKEFIEDMEGNATVQRMSEWCQEKLDLPINPENIEEVLQKAQKYCLGGEITSTGASKFKNFKNIFTSLQKSGINRSHMAGLQMVHLGESEIDDVYYLFGTGDDLEKTDLNVISSSRKETFAKRLFIEDKYGILDTYNPKNNDEWYERGQMYMGLNPYDKGEYKNLKKIPKLEDAFSNLRSDGKGTQTNLLKQKCADLLRQKFYNQKDYDEAHGHFINWCAKDPKIKYSPFGILASKNKRSNLSK